jgi:hypothetical protein
MRVCHIRARISRRIDRSRESFNSNSTTSVSLTKALLQHQVSWLSGNAFEPDRCAMVRGMLKSLRTTFMGSTNNDERRLHMPLLEFGGNVKVESRQLTRLTSLSYQFSCCVTLSTINAFYRTNAIL